MIKEIIKKDAIVAIIRGVTQDEAVDVAQTMYEAGIRIIEVPLNSPSPFESIRKIVDALGDKMLVGAGTVLTPGNVQRLYAAGGKIVVSPNMKLIAISETRILMKTKLKVGSLATVDWGLSNSCCNCRNFVRNTLKVHCPVDKVEAMNCPFCNPYTVVPKTGPIFMEELSL